MDDAQAGMVYGFDQRIAAFVNHYMVTGPQG